MSGLNPQEYDLTEVRRAWYCDLNRCDCSFAIWASKVACDFDMLRLGADTAAASEHAASTVDTGGGWQAWLGDQRMIDAKEAARLSQPPPPRMRVK